MITPEGVVEESKQWSRDEVAKLVDLLTEELYGSREERNDQAWKAEIRQRVDEIERGKVALQDGDEVSEKVRKLVHS
jgi:molybdopterin converting factor small subunit